MRSLCIPRSRSSLADISILILLFIVIPFRYGRYYNLNIKKQLIKKPPLAVLQTSRGKGDTENKFTHYSQVENELSLLQKKNVVKSYFLKISSYAFNIELFSLPHQILDCYFSNLIQVFHLIKRSLICSRRRPAARRTRRAWLANLS